MFTTAYVPPQSGIPTGRIVQRVLASRGLSQKSAALTMGGLHYEATLSKGLAGLGPLDLHALMMLDAKTLWKCFRHLLTAKLAAEERDVFGEKEKTA